ncbi:MAG: cache domain-containing protein, partial [Acidobacteria bacterium]|nr:cache domain-containing protein [Acidobacteriota bacterium]
MRNLSFYVGMIVGVIAFSIVASSLQVYFSLQKQMQSNFSLQMQRSEAMNDLYRQIEMPVHLSRWMRQDPFLKAWVESGEQDTAALFQFLSHSTQNSPYKAFFASNVSRTYYFSDGSQKPLNEKTPDVDWFFSLLDRQVAELADVGYPNGDLGHPFLFVDMEIRSEMKGTLGYIGIAVELDHFLAMIYKHKQNFEEDLHFVNQEGVVILSSKSVCVNTPADQYEWYQQTLTMPTTANGVNVLPTPAHLWDPSPGSSFASVFLDELGWTLVMEKNYQKGHETARQIAIRSLGGLVVMLILVTGFLYLLQKRFRADLERAFEEIHTLKGILPICASCKKIRDD